MIFIDFRKSWDAMMSIETRVGEDSQRQQYNRRTQKLKRLFRRQHLERNILQQCKLRTLSWTRSIQEMEEVRYAKSLQDLDDHVRFVKNEWKNLVRDVCRKGAIWEEKDGTDAVKPPTRWRLDFTEARSRMRRKLRVDERKSEEPYLPKQGGSSASMDAKISSLSIPKNIKSSPLPAQASALPKSKIDKLKDADVASVASLDKLPESKSDVDSAGENALAQDTASTSGSEAATAPEQEEGSTTENSESVTAEADDDDRDAEPAFEEAANRKILRLLEAGDVVYEVYNMSRVTGLDAVEGLLLLCKHNMYLIDNYFQKMDGEVVDISEVADSERDQYLQLLASNNPPSSQPAADTSEVRHQCRKWRFEDIKEVHRRRYLLRNVALELFFVDGRNYLINLNLQQRDIVYNQLASRVGSLANNSLQVGDRSAMVDPNSNNNQAPSSLGSKLANIFAPSSIADITAKWEKHEISNFQYLMHLNTMAGRTYNDLTQYPVFPWILADYTSAELDLTNPKTFRDLSRPMGAQTPDREKDFNDRYHTWDGGDDRIPPFHYGTHYSSAMIVCSYLIRLEPFTQEYLKLQGGQFDHADRLFHSIGKSWVSASQKTMSDVRELIPEFFYLPEFLMNANAFNFGTLQTTGEQIDHVALPPWAKDDPKVFIEKHREALECDYVSAHLHEWIDLIFGHKQQGPESVRAVNVFHHLSYEGAIDLDTIDDPIQKSATIGIIHNFGQTPRQLFKKPHGPRLPPNRDPLSPNYYHLATHAEYLTQSVIPVKGNDTTCPHYLNIYRHIFDASLRFAFLFTTISLDIGLPVGEIIYQGDKAFVGHSQRTYEPYGCSKYVEWGFSDNSVRLYQTETNKTLGIFENVHLEAITSVKWADDRTIVTTSRDTVVCVWRIVQGRSYELKLMKCLRGHRETVHAVAISVAYSIIVSGSEDKSCIIWDLNRLEYVRQLGRHEDGVRVVAINDATGDIATCSGPVLRLWTVNGDMILQKYTTQIGDPILDCVFYSGKTGEWLSKEIVLTSHRRGTIKVWEKAVIDAEYQRSTATAASGGHQQGGRSSGSNSASISSLQSSVDSISLSTSNLAVIPTTVVEENGTDNGGHNAGELAGSITPELSMSNLSIAAGEDDSLTSGSRTRQSSQAVALTGGNKLKSAKWALRLRQAYTYEDRLRLDGGVVPNIVSLYISRYA
jgi:WD40 repeat protein